MIVGAFVFDEFTVGITELSATRSPSIPLSLRSGVTTAMSSTPILHVPAGW